MNHLSFLDVDPAMLKTEERIIVAAINVFAEYPVQVATVRMIAQEAQVNFSSITYYFKTKENLYHEVIRRILGYVVQSMLSSGEWGTKPLTPETAREELLGMIETLTSWIYGNSKATLFAKIILREHVSPSPVYEMLYNDFFKKVIAHMTQIVRFLADVSETDTGEREAALLTFSIFGQILGFRLEREMLVRHLGFVGFSADEIVELKALLVRNIFRQLGVTP